MTQRSPLTEDVALSNRRASRSLSWRADAHFSPWLIMFVVSCLMTLGLAGLVWSLRLQYWITQALIALFVGLGWISPAGRWGSVLGSTISAMLLLFLVLQPEYGFAGQVTYGIGSFLFSAAIVLPAAAARSRLSKL